MRTRPAEMGAASQGPCSSCESHNRRETNGVGANGVTANCSFFDRWTFWVLPLSCFYLPKSARACLFPQSVKIHYFCSGPVSVDPICPQPRQVQPIPLSRHSLLRGAGDVTRERHTCVSLRYVCICMYMYVCMYIYIYMICMCFMYVYLCIHVYPYMHIYIYIYTYIRML